MKPWLDTVQEGYEVHYIILSANKEETMKRAVNRAKLDRETNIELVESMWEQFQNPGIYESNVIDTTNFLIQDTVSAIKARLASKTMLLLDSFLLERAYRFQVIWMTNYRSNPLGANFNDRDLNYFYIEIKIRKQKCTFESFFIPKLGEYHSYKIDIVPKMEYHILEREVYSLCI